MAGTVPSPRLMCRGDSNTGRDASISSTISGTYRPQLETNALAENVTLNPIGWHANGSGTAKQHCGFPGYLIEDLQLTNGTVNTVASTGANVQGGMLRDLLPEVILEMCGTNNLAGADTAAAAIAKYVTFITDTLSKTSNVDIFVLSIVPADPALYPVLAGKIHTFNGLLPAMVSTTINNPLVHYIDYAAGMTVADLDVTGQHLGASGCTKGGNNLWADATLKARLKQQSKFGYPYGGSSQFAAYGNLRAEFDARSISVDNAGTQPANNAAITHWQNLADKLWLPALSAQSSWGPVFKTLGWTGGTLPCAQFTAASNQRTQGGGASGCVGGVSGAGATMFFVVKATAAGAGAGALTDGIFIGGRAECIVDPDGGTVTLGTDVGDSISGACDTTTSPVVLRFVLNGAASAIYRNGVLVASGALCATGVGAANSGVSIGGTYAGTTTFSGILAHALQYDAVLANAACAAIELALRTIWGF